MYTDMLRRVIAETAHAHVHELVHKFHVILLEERILGVYVRKTAHTLMSALSTVIIVLDTLETMCMEHFLPSAYCSIELVRDKVDIEGCMVRKNIDKYSYIILLRRVEHCLHLLFRTHYVVSYSPVSRLVVVVPVTFLLIKNLLVSTLRAETCVYRRCLDHSESRIGNLLHVLSDSREVPAPYMKYRFSVGSIRIMCHTVCKLGLRCACDQAETRNNG